MTTSRGWLGRRLTRRLPWLLGWLVAPLLSLALVWSAHVSGSLQSLSDNILDQFFHWRGERPTDQRIIIVGIDEESLARLGMWPFPRSLHARLLARMREAKAVGFDILFREATKDDKEFSQAMAAGAPVFLSVAQDSHGQLLTPSETLSGYAGLGHIHTPISPDGVARGVLPHYDGLPLLSLAMVGEKAGRVANRQLLINYYGKEKTFPYLSYFDVLDGHIDPHFFAGRYVLIGAEAAGLGDVHATPYTKTRPSPGVEVQATVLGNLLENNFLTSFSRLSWFVALAVFVMALLLWPNIPIVGHVLTFVFLGTSLLAASYLFFLRNIFFDPIPSLLTLACTYMTYLILQGLWLARRMFLAVNALNTELVSGLQNTYITIPRQFLQIRDRRTFMSNFPGEISEYLRRMDEGILALNAQNRFIHHLLSEATPPIILWEKQNGAVVLASTLFRRLWHDMRIQPEPPTAGQFLALLDDDGQKERSVEALAAETRPRNLIVRLPGKKSSYFQVVFQNVATGDGFFSGIIAILTDVTELRELEKMKSEVLSVVSHELRLPLTTILGYSEMLLAVLPTEHRQHAEEIYSQTQRLNKMIDNFLDISRIESGKYVLRGVPLDILAVAHDAVFAVHYAAKEKEISIESHLPSKCSPVYGDEPLLLQAIINLLENAVKFSPPQSRIVFVIREEKEHIAIEVADQGPGILHEDQEAVFSKFHRGANVGREDGFGLGLSLVRQVAIGHGGSIELLTFAPEGAHFLIRLPKNARA
ncbi:MAG: CHASE2 domain-containing protein [Desulfobulbaceae bacterium]|jgi:CHASE2 domain-containing sensor protein/signal transduction histidine kinase|nr:CHASE2 domain-containing protein [Desulfobulbaceae bacterium]